MGLRGVGGIRESRFFSFIATNVSFAFVLSLLSGGVVAGVCESVNL